MCAVFFNSLSVAWQCNHPFLTKYKHLQSRAPTSSIVISFMWVYFLATFLSRESSLRIRMSGSCAIDRVANMNSSFCWFMASLYKFLEPLGCSIDFRSVGSFLSSLFFFPATSVSVPFDFPSHCHWCFFPYLASLAVSPSWFAAPGLLREYSHGPGATHKPGMGGKTHGWL